MSLVDRFQGHLLLGHSAASVWRQILAHNFRCIAYLSGFRRLNIIVERTNDVRFHMISGIKTLAHHQTNIRPGFDKPIAVLIAVVG